MEWIESGLLDLRSRLERKLADMLQQKQEPRQTDWDEMRSYTALYYQLKEMGKQVTKVKPRVIVTADSPASDRRRIAIDLEKAPILGERIEKLRKKNELTTTELGAMIGHTATSIRKIESGQNRPSVGSLHKLCEVFGVTEQELLGGIYEADSPARPDDEEPASTTTEEPSEADRSIGRIGTLSLQLRGGTLRLDDGGELYLFQSIIDRLDLWHDDRVIAYPDGTYDDGTTKYYYTVPDGAQSTKATNPEIGQVIGSCKRYDSTYYAVDAGGGKLVLFNATDYRGRYVAEGDVVTVSYWKKGLDEYKETRGSLIQIHEVPQLLGSGQQASRPKPKPVKVKEIAAERDPLPAFDGEPKVLVVGGRHWDRYRDVLTGMRAEPVHVTADGRPNVDAVVQGADIIIVITTYMNHPLRLAVSMAAKKSGIFYYETEYEQVSGFTRFVCEEVLPNWNGAHTPAKHA